MRSWSRPCRCTRCASSAGARRTCVSARCQANRRAHTSCHHHDPPANAGPRSRLQLASGGLLRWPRIPPGMLHTRPTMRDVHRAGRARAPLSMSLSAHARTSLSPEVEVQGWMVGLRRSRCARAVARAPTQMFADSEVGGGVMKCPNRGLPPRCARTGPYAWCTAADTLRAPCVHACPCLGRCPSSLAHHARDCAHDVIWSDSHA